MTLVEELRSKKSRDNRGLLDRAADRIEELDGELTELINERDEARRDCGMAQRNYMESAESVKDLHIQLDAMRTVANSYKKLYEELKEENLNLIKGLAELKKKYTEGET